MRIVCVALGIAALAGGCSAEIGESSGEIEADAAAVLPDAGDPGGAAIDAALPDPPPDAAVPPDAALGPDASLEDLCAAAYSDVPGFELCSTLAGACSFIALNETTSCQQHCSARGGTCVSAFDNKVGFCDEFESNQDVSCTSIGRQDLLCTCTVP